MSLIEHRPTSRWLLRICSILWIIWGLVHILAGIMTMSQDTTAAIQDIADAVDPASLEMAYPPAAGAVINQHGFNLLWIGLVTTICARFIWRHSFSAVCLAALVGGLADLGYFIFLDLGGFVNFFPGTLMTLVSSAAIITGFWPYLSSRSRQLS
ncbi:MAG: hypothetical protein AAF604_05560 [Acidobacteriota bacterium]